MPHARAQVLTDAQTASALVLKREFAVDSTGDKTLTQVLALPFHATPHGLARGYTHSATWLRLQVAAAAQPRVLLVRPAYLDDVRLYSPDTQGGWRVQQLGDRYPYAGRGHKTVNLAFVLGPSGTETTHYMRVHSRSSTLVETDLLSMGQSAQHDKQVHALFGLHAGVLLTLFAVALVRWRMSQRPVWLAHGLFLVVALLLAFSQTGFAAAYLWPMQPATHDMATNVLNVLSVFALSLMFWMNLHANGASAWVTRIYALCCWLTPLLLLAVYAGAVSAALLVVALLVVGQALWMAVAIWFVPFTDAFQKVLLRVAYVLLIAYALYFVLPVLGLFRPWVSNGYPAVLANMFVALVLYASLTRSEFVRARLQEQDRARARELQNLLQWEKAKRAESVSFLSMLLHELKTPLTSIRLNALNLAQGKVQGYAAQMERLARIQQQVDVMDGVLDRTRQADRLEHGAQAIQPEDVAVPELIAQVLAQCAQPARVHTQGLAQQVVAQTDPQLLQMMLANLLANALMYSPPASAVHLSLELPAGDDHAPSFAVTVRNLPGKAGMPDAAQLFHKYYRAEHARSSTGAGLGLFWVRGVARLMGGEVSYAAVPWQESACDECLEWITFTLRLPLRTQGMEVAPQPVL